MFSRGPSRPAASTRGAWRYVYKVHRAARTGTGVQCGELSGAHVSREDHCLPALCTHTRPLRLSMGSAAGERGGGEIKRTARRQDGAQHATHPLRPGGHDEFQPGDDHAVAGGCGCISISDGIVHFLLPGFPATPPRNHNHPQLRGSTPTDGVVKGLFWLG